VELARRTDRAASYAIWLIVFATALASTQALILSGVLQVTDARQLSGAGSLSGAIIGA
jgi:beta-lactamase regulating signal transducer with metallopeptidase domain